MGTKRKIKGPGRLGSDAAFKKSLKGGGQSQVRTIPGEDGLTVRFLQNPPDWHGYYEHWMSDGPIPCADDCVGCESDDEEERRKSFKYLANAYIVDDQKVRAVKLPKTLAEQLAGYYAKYKTLFDRDYELTKSGSGKTGTKYMASPDSPEPMKLSRFEDQMLDLDKVLLSMLGDDDADDDYDDEYEPPKRKKKSASVKKSKRDPWEDDDDDEEETPARRVPKKKVAPRKKVAPKRAVRR